MRFLARLALTAATAVMLTSGANAETPATPSPVDRAREARQRICLNEAFPADQRLLICTSIIKGPPGDPKALVSIYIGRGNAYVAKNDYAHAQSDFDEATKIDPSNAGPLNGRGLMFVKMKQPDRAIAEFDQAIKLNPKDAIPLFNRGNVYRAKRQIDRALQDYNSAIEVNPGLIGAYMVRAAVFDDKSRYDFDAFLNEGSFEDHAIADYSQVIQLAPKFVSAYNDRGSLYQRERKYDLALADFTQAIQIDPNNVLYIRNRAITHAIARHFELAIADYRAALKLDLDPATRNQIQTALKDLGAAP
jgi:tetratricopeptide (TPR) repeat protein